MVREEEAQLGLDLDKVRLLRADGGGELHQGLFCRIEGFPGGLPGGLFCGLLLLGPFQGLLFALAPGRRPIAIQRFPGAGDQPRAAVHFAFGCGQRFPGFGQVPFEAAVIEIPEPGLFPLEFRPQAFAYIQDCGRPGDRIHPERVERLPERVARRTEGVPGLGEAVAAARPDAQVNVLPDEDVDGIRHPVRAPRGRLPVSDPHRPAR